MTMTNMTAYLDNLLNQAGFDNPDQIAMMREELEPILIDRLFAAILAKVPMEQQDEFVATVEAGKPEEFDALCRSYVSNYDEIMSNTLDVFAREYLESFEEDDNDL